MPIPKFEECSTCGVRHPSCEPHDKTSFFYQIIFSQEHKREVTWEDAMRHCDEETKEFWRKELRERGIDPNT